MRDLVGQSVIAKGHGGKAGAEEFTGMQKNFPLGPLAYAVIEQFGDLAETALTDAVRWRQTANGCVDEGACAISGRLFADEELASQPLQPGNWLSIGMVGDGVHQAVIEINLTDGSTREKAMPS